MSIALIVDLLLLIIILGCVFRGIKDGMVGSVISFVGLIAAFFGAKAVAEYMTPGVSKSFFQSGMSRMLNEAVSKVTPEGTVASAADITKIAGDAFATMGLPINVINRISERLAVTVDTAGKSIVNAFAISAADTFAFASIFVLAFGVILLVSVIITSVANSFVRLPGLDILNKVGGAALGLLFGLFVTYALAIAVSWFWPFIIKTFELPPIISFIDKTTLFKFFINYNPMELFFLP